MLQVRKAGGSGVNVYEGFADLFVHLPPAGNERCPPFSGNSCAGCTPWRCIFVNGRGDALWCKEGLPIGGAALTMLMHLNWKTRGGLVAGIQVRADRDGPPRNGYWRRLDGHLQNHDGCFDRAHYAEQYRVQMERFERRRLNQCLE